LLALPQAQAKKVLAVAVHNHYKRVEHEMEASARQQAVARAAAAASTAEAEASGLRLSKQLNLNLSPEQQVQFGLAAQARNQLNQVGRESESEGGENSFFCSHSYVYVYALNASRRLTVLPLLTCLTCHLFRPFACFLLQPSSCYLYSAALTTLLCPAPLPLPSNCCSHPLATCTLMR
jgi:hypothetical protein